MTTKEQYRFIRDTLLEFWDGTLGLDAAVAAIMECAIPKPPPPRESIQWARQVIAEYESAKCSATDFVLWRSKEIASDPEKTLEYLKEIGSIKP